MKSTQSSLFHFSVPGKRIRWLYVRLLAGELALIMVYLILKFGADERLPWILHIIRNQCNLTAENVVAVWLSGMLLLSISFAAMLCFQLDTGSKTKGGIRGFLRYGWLVIALTFAGFSLDEIGSLHERLDKILPLNLMMQGPDMRHWVIALAPIMIVVFLFFMFFFFHQMAQSRLCQYLAVLGTTFLASVPFQEWIATSAGKGGHLLSVVEESAEMIGMTLIFIGFLEFAISSAARTTRSDEKFEIPVVIPVRLGTFEMRLLYTIMVTAALGTLWLAWYFVPLLEDIPSRGDPRAWYPSAVLFTAGLGAIIIPYSIGEESIQTKTVGNTASFGIGFICLILSQDRVSGVVGLALTQLMRPIGLTNASWLAETLAWALPLGLCIGIVLWAWPRVNRDRVLLILGCAFCIALANGFVSVQMKELLNLVVPSLIAIAILSPLDVGSIRPNMLLHYTKKRVPTSNL